MDNQNGDVDCGCATCKASKYLQPKQKSVSIQVSLSQGKEFMPLAKGSSQKTISKNISKLKKEGYEFKRKKHEI